MIKEETYIIIIKNAEMFSYKWMKNQILNLWKIEFIKELPIVPELCAPKKKTLKHSSS